jgi:hypothetical protein
MKECALPVRRAASTRHRMDGSGGCRAQSHDMCRGMTAVVAGRMPFVIQRYAARSVEDLVMFSGFIKMSVPCPDRSVTEGTEDEPGHEQPSEHMRNLPQISRPFQNPRPRLSGTALKKGPDHCVENDHAQPWTNKHPPHFPPVVGPYPGRYFRGRSGYGAIRQKPERISKYFLSLCFLKIVPGERI